MMRVSPFPFNATAPSDIYTLSLHDALPICSTLPARPTLTPHIRFLSIDSHVCKNSSEEHTSELQSRFDLVCRLLLEKKNGCGQTAIFGVVGTLIAWTVAYS